jgi:FSR family fosmidomycin resistance protein-like MFS transporter
MSTNLKILFALTLVHFTGDFYTSFINPLFPVFVDKLGLTLTQIGIIAGVVDLLAFVIQPTIGYLADRYQTRLFIFIGLLLSVVFIPLSGIAPSFGVLLLCVSLGAIGSSMFHPSVTGMVPVYAGTKVSFSMSIFVTGGILAFGFGPLFITWYVAFFGLTAMPVTMIAGLVVIAFLITAIPNPQSEGMKRSGFFEALKESLGSSWKVVALVLFVMFLRGLVELSFLTFMPVLFVQDGFSVVSAGTIYALFIVSGTTSGLLSGHIADRIGFKPVFLFTFLFMAPALWLLMQLNGNWVYLGAVLAGSFVLAPLPLGISLAQTLAPRGRSMVASLMGFAYGLGGLLAPIVGKLADIYTIRPVLTFIACIPLFAVPIIALFPRVRSGSVLPNCLRNISKQEHSN